MNRRDLAMLLALFAIAFGLRFYDVATPPARWADETVHVPAATLYWTTGHFDFWEHPPLRHVLLKGFLELLGDNPYGWRMRNVLFGSLAAVLVGLFAFSIDGSRATAGIAGLLMATDPLHVAYSRFTFEEVYGGAFFVAALVLFANTRGRRSWLVLSALSFGCALATKWYYVPAWLLVTALALREDDNYRRPADAFFVASTLLVLPLLVYVLSYWKWFGRGYSAGELVELVTNAYYSLQSWRGDMFNPEHPYLRQASALDWFVTPVMFGEGTYLTPDTGRFLVFGNNLPVWGLALPAVALSGVLAARRRSLRWGLPALLFVATYSLFVIIRRPTFIYNAIPLLPLALTAIALGISWISQRFGSPGRRVAWALFACMVASNLYLYPLATAREIPVALYRHVLSRVDLTLR